MSDAQRGSPAAGEGWRIENPKLLLVEGIDEVRLFCALAKHIGSEDVQIRPYQGKDNLRRFLQVLPRVPGYSELESIGVARDLRGRRDFDSAQRPQCVGDLRVAVRLRLGDAPRTILRQSRRRRLVGAQSGFPNRQYASLT